MSNPSQLVQKLWNYCNILRDDGLSYGDYVEQLTFLLFLKMADEQAKPPFNRPSAIPKGFGWDMLLKLEAVVSASLPCGTRLRQSILQIAFTGSGRIGTRSITHEEFRAAIRRRKPRWFMAHRDVTFSRQLLKPYMFKRNGHRTKFKLKENPVLDDLRVIDLYNDAIQNDVP